MKHRRAEAWGPFLFRGVQLRSAAPRPYVGTDEGSGGGRSQEESHVLREVYVIKEVFEGTR